MLPVPSARVLRLVPALAASIALGCASHSHTHLFPFGKRRAALRKSVADLQRRNADLRQRAAGLDANNEQLQRSLAEQQQHEQQMQSDLAAQQPVVPYDQLQVDAQTASNYDSSWAQPVDAAPPAVASAPSQSGNWLPMTDIPGAQVYREGDVVRVRLTNADLFAPGRATLRSNAKRNLRRVAQAIRDNYPGYLIGIEGHTDSDPIRKSKWKHNHELSVKRAMAVYDYLRADGGISSSQLFVAGYGPNRPIASNASARGKSQNRRVELALYPDQLGGN